MTKAKKVVSLLLSLLMIITTVFVTAIGSFAETSGDYEYSVLNDGTAAISGYTGNAKELAIPSEIDGYKITCIDSKAFEDCYFIESVIIPEGVTAINSKAFSGCDGLKSITLPDSLTSIGYGAFVNTAYQNDNTNYDNGMLYIGKWLTNTNTNGLPEEVIVRAGTVGIADQAFGNQPIKSIIASDGLIYIGENAFAGCSNLNSITLPDSVRGISSSTFYSCAYYYNDANWENGVLYISNHLIASKNDMESLTIKDGTKTISEYAFLQNVPFESVTVPESVVEIGECGLGYYYADDTTKVDGFTIYGFTGSEAERYANDNDFKFVSIGVTYTLTFPDVPANEWYYPAIASNVAKGYFHGYENGYFGPCNNIQRQDFVVVLSKIAGADLSAYAGQNGGFSDVPTNDYYSAAVAWAKDNHILSGYADGKFGVGDPITREQACVIFFNYITGYCDMGVGSSNTPEEICSRYPDGNAVSDWARTAVAWAAENHIVGGNGKLNPAGNANRAEMAQIIMNMSSNNIL